MSEGEKKRRLEYRKKRRRLLLIQSIIAIILGLTIVASSIVYFRINSNYLINYTEQSVIDYKVYLKPNREYDEEFLGQGQSYIATLIDYVDIDFKYQIDLDSEWANYISNYTVDAKLTIKDNTNKKPLYTHVYPLKENVIVQTTGGDVRLMIKENIVVDYDQYNDFANSFKNVYSLSDVTCQLDVAMRIQTNGSCAEFSNADFGRCSFSLNIPLTQKTIEINMLSSIPAGKTDSIVCENCINKNCYKNIALIALGLEIVVLLIILIYAYSTRNHDINYEIKIKKLISAYKPYIQKLLTEFSFDGYQILEIETFEQMLDIRDTINSPILMSENADKTCTQFLIPTDNGILYMFNIKVDDYDEIYSNVQLPPEEIQNVEIEGSLIEEMAVTEDVKDFRNGVKYDYSFDAKLHLAKEETRHFYEHIASFVQSYGLTINKSWNKEKIQFGKKTYAIMSFKGLKLTVSFALNLADYEGSKYKLVDVSNIKKFVNYPAQMKITSDRKSVWVTELLVDMLSKDGVEDKKLNVIVNKIKPKTKRRLIREKLIKVK